MMLISLIIFISQIAFGSASFAQYKPSSTLFKRGHQLVKRGDDSFSGRATYYSTGLGACGNTNTDSDFIVALNSPQYNANKWCGKKIKISFGGKSTTATIEDQCPGCPSGGLDLSPSLFEFFASKDVGVFYMKWSLDDGSSDNPSHAASPAPSSPTPTPTPSPTPPASTPTPSPSPPPFSSPPTNTDDQSTLSKVVDSSPPSKQTGAPSSLQNNTTFSTSNTTATIPKSTSTSAANQVNVAGPSTNQQIISTNSIQSNNPYASGGNLDTINQLVISFGGLTAASAENALNKQT